MFDLAGSHLSVVDCLMGSALRIKSFLQRFCLLHFATAVCVFVQKPQLRGFTFPFVS